MERPSSELIAGEDYPEDWSQFLDWFSDEEKCLKCYTYHATKKHAVTAAGGNTYAYDANGNQNSRNGASIAWTSYNLPGLINQSGGNSSQFWYGAGRQRFKQVNVNGATTGTTITVAGVLEKVTVGTVTDWKHYVQGGTGVAAIVIRSSTGTNTTYYPLKDHLGSTDRITNSSGSVVVALSYDAFGKRRGSNWTGNPTSGDLSNIAASTRHGFTSHEHLDNLTLVQKSACRAAWRKSGRELPRRPKLLAEQFLAQFLVRGRAVIGEAYLGAALLAGRWEDFLDNSKECCRTTRMFRRHWQPASALSAFARGRRESAATKFCQR